MLRKYSSSAKMDKSTYLATRWAAPCPSPAPSTAYLWSVSRVHRLQHKDCRKPAYISMVSTLIVWAIIPCHLLLCLYSSDAPRSPDVHLANKQGGYWVSWYMNSEDSRAKANAANLRRLETRERPDYPAAGASETMGRNGIGRQTPCIDHVDLEQC